MQQDHCSASIRHLSEDQELCRRDRANVFTGNLLLGVRGKPPRHLSNSWRLLRRPFFVQAAPLLVIVAVGANAVWLRGTPSAARSVPAPVASVAPTTPPAPEKQPPQLAVCYRRPSQAD